MSSVAERPFWSMHSHSRFSAKDALPSVQSMVEAASTMNYPALGLTDHGVPSGNIILYKACRKFGIEPLPGMELYVVPDAEYAKRSDSMHLTMVAYSEAGYRNLCRIATLTAKNFFFKPLIDFADFADLAANGYTAGLAVATGCYFGVIPQVLMRRGHSEAVKVAQTLAGWFPQVYVELQNHGIGVEHHSDLDVTDDELVAGVYDVAQAAGLPCVITRDSHYVNESDKHLHEALKRLVAFGEDPDDAVFPGGGYFMTDLAGMRKYLEPKYIEAGMEGLNILADKAYLRLPEMESFSLKIPDVTYGADPQKVLEDKIDAALEERGWSTRPSLLRQTHNELDEFRRQGMSPYILLCDMVCEFMRAKDISFHVRGSATGSLVLYLLGVTQLDPMVFALRFDRFMSPNRLKPPDVDFDIEHTRIDEVVTFLSSRFSVRRIGSLRKYTMFEDPDEEEGKGSLRVQYFSTMKKRGIPTGAWRDIPRKDRDELLALSKMKLVSGYGTHAAGYIISPDEATVAQLPMAWIASSKKLVTAIGKKDVEQLGFLKLDLLGLKTRTAIKVTEELTGISFESIPLTDRATFAAISAGRNTAVFQLEGYTMNHGAKAIRPTKIGDVIALQALYRPAAMHSDATANYRDRRRKKEEVPVRHKDIMDATGDTYGVMLYQESVMDILETLGMDKVELEQMLDAVKASNEYSAGAAVVIEEKMPRIKTLATGRGWDQEDIDWLVDSLGAYAEYSFNKAHAASYGVVSYRTAYMKVHYPVEFWTGIMVAYAASKKEKLYVPAARKEGIRILPPMINYSGVSYSMEGTSIRKGYLSINGVGPVAALELAEKGPFTSLTDLGKRVLARKVSGARLLALGTEPHLCGGIITRLDEAHALDKLPRDEE